MPITQDRFIAVLTASSHFEQKDLDLRTLVHNILPLATQLRDASDTAGLYEYFLTLCQKIASNSPAEIEFRVNLAVERKHFQINANKNIRVRDAVRRTRRRQELVGIATSNEEELNQVFNWSQGTNRQPAVPTSEPEVPIPPIPTEVPPPPTVEEILADLPEPNLPQTSDYTKFPFPSFMRNMWKMHDQMVPLEPAFCFNASNLKYVAETAGFQLPLSDNGAHLASFLLRAGAIIGYGREPGTNKILGFVPNPDAPNWQQGEKLGPWGERLGGLDKEKGQPSWLRNKTQPAETTEPVEIISVDIPDSTE